MAVKKYRQSGCAANIAIPLFGAAVIFSFIKNFFSLICFERQKNGTQLKYKLPNVAIFRPKLLKYSYVRVILLMALFIFDFTIFTPFSYHANQFRAKPSNFSRYRSHTKMACRNQIYFTINNHIKNYLTTNTSNRSHTITPF